MHLSRLLPALAIALLAAMPAARAEVLISIDKNKQQMTVTVDGAERYVWPVSTGTRSYDTPAGDFQPFRMARHHFSREWDDAQMPYSIFFTQDGHAIHGSYERRRLGRPASHGCVRLAPENAAVLFALVKEQGVKNARVVLSGDLPSATELAARLGNGNAEAEAPRPRKPRRVSADDYFGGSYERPDSYARRSSPFFFPFGW
jgi:L,D-transpeptidase catalytic domain